MSEHYEDHRVLKEIIEKNIQNNTHFLIGRFSDIETRVVHHYIIKKNKKGELFQLENNAGIHIKDLQSLNTFTRTVFNAFRDCTVHGIWKNDVMSKCIEDSQTFIRKFAIQVPAIYAAVLEPMYFFEKGYDATYLRAFRGKRVLIVSPFVDTMKTQVERGALKHIYGFSEYMDGVEFIFVKAPVTLAGNHNGKDWQEHFAGLKESIAAAGEFDIALLGCGGYGMPASHYIYKELGKSAIYVGGALQLFFGIMGRRWLKSEFYAKYYTGDKTKTYWVTPDVNEKPPGLKRVEGGCYW